MVLIPFHCYQFFQQNLVLCIEGSFERKKELMLQQHSPAWLGINLLTPLEDTIWKGHLMISNMLFIKLNFA